MKYLTKKSYVKKTQAITANFPTRNWENYEERWGYHEWAVKWLKKLKPTTILEIGGLGVKLREDSKTLDNGAWKYDHSVDYRQDVRDLDIPFFDCIVALRVLHHYPESFEMIFGELKMSCRYLILALPRGFSVPPPTDMVKCGGTNLYLYD